MSRTRQIQKSKNPAKKFLSLSGVTGKFGYWDKEQNCKIELEYPIVCFPLDVLATIKGFNDKLQAGFYSNEVHSISEEILKVKVFEHGEFATGLYSDIKDKIKIAGAKFCNSVYAMMYNEHDESEIVNFQLQGAALSPFIEYMKEVKHIYKHSMNIVGVEKAKKGATTYFIPTYASGEMVDGDNLLADCLDVELQEYLDEYKLGQISSARTIETDIKEEDWQPDETTISEDTPFGG